METPKKRKAERIEKVLTHNGPFHTDEVFATAILKDLFPEEMQHADGSKTDYVKYIRTRDATVLEQARQSDSEMVVDVGMEYNPALYNLDHHQKGGAGKRENGIEYATAGLVWKQYGREWIKYIDAYTRQANLSEQEIDFIWKQIDEQYIQNIDANDTGQMEDISYSLSTGEKVSGGQFSLPELVGLYNVDTRDGRNNDARFKQAVEVYRDLTLAMVHKQINLIEGLRKFDMNACEFGHEGRTAVLDKGSDPVVTGHLMQHAPEFQKTEFFATKNLKGEYVIVVVPKSENSRESRNARMIPEDIRLGGNVAAINEKIGVEKGVLFVHTKGFMASVADRETAKRILDYCATHA